MKTKPPYLKVFVLLLGLLYIIPISIRAQTIEGDWYGKAEIGDITLRLTIHVKADDKGYSSTWDSPDQGAFGVASTATSFTYPDFSFSHAGAGFKYTGKVNTSYTEIAGNLEQAGVKLDITFGREPVAAAPNSTEGLKKRYDKKEVYITMRDGVRLFIPLKTTR
jgi:hypothetical protein